MLNISKVSVSKFIDVDKYSAFKKLESRKASGYLIKVLMYLTLLSILSMFLPWTQNIRSKGYVTALNPSEKHQDIQSLISGKISKWYVQEGQVLNVGDTIAVISESKEEYLDPDIIENTQQQREAKINSAEAYESKVLNLRQQLAALKNNYNAKVEQNNIKFQQFKLKIESDSLDLLAANTKVENAVNQLKRMEAMYDKGIKSLTELETKRLSLREAEAKVTSATNKLLQNKNEIIALRQERINIDSDYSQKMAKIEGEIRSTESYIYSLIGDSEKLESTVNKLTERSKAYAILSPINGTLTQALKNGIGEFVKAQESIATIIPLKYTVAAELFVLPRDIPLIKKGNKVRLLFDGWPAVVFSGWPQNSFGTFGGKVFAIDNFISDNGKYRVLVVEDENEDPWPPEVRIGSGANGLLLLNEVKIYYELWRQLNGFPPDYYQGIENNTTKTKAPIRKIK